MQVSSQSNGGIIATDREKQPQYCSCLDWMKAALPMFQATRFPIPTSPDVTLLAYWFWDDDRLETRFWEIECAFLCAYDRLGLLPSVLVVNRETGMIRDFCSRYRIDLQVETSLTGEGTEAMSIDCISELHARFQTDYVLIVQSDGFPLSSNLVEFLGKWDYIGAPWPGHLTNTDWFPYPRFGVGNGGFSLRSKAICRSAAESWRFWRRVPVVRSFEEDVYFCKAMPFFSRRWRKHFRYPSLAEAAQFSIESIVPVVGKPKKPPLGFHSRKGFQLYCQWFGVPSIVQTNSAP